MKTAFSSTTRVLFYALVLACASAAAIAALAARSLLHDNRTIAAFTVHPGERLSEVWARLEAEGLASQGALVRIAATASFPEYPFVPDPRSDPNRFEGLFVPGSYRISLALDPSLSRDEQLYREDLQIVKILLEKFAARLGRYRDLASGSPSYGQIILASIVQKEDVPGQDYGLVASVFLNRMKAGMHLSSCPTLEYSLGYHRPFLLAKDIAVDSPYNTYLHGGLPPTPICFFTDQALESVVRPIASPYYFFVLDWIARRIYFASTYSEQLRNSDIARENYERVYGAESLHKKEVGVFYRDN